MAPKIWLLHRLRGHHLLTKSSSGFGIPPSLSLPPAPVADHQSCRSEFGFPNMLGLVLAGCVLGAGLTVAQTDHCLIKGAHCEGASLGVENHLPIPGLDPAQSLRTRFGRFSDWIRRRIFFMYERRIRAYSSPQKVFEYFASIKDPKRQYFMTPDDLMRAIIPALPPSESSIIRGGYLMGERLPGELHCSPSSFFMLFDTNGDGRISFEEYEFVKILLITSLESFTATFKMFDRDGNGTITKNEFAKVMQLMRTRNKVGSGQHGGFHNRQSSVGTAGNIQLLTYLFGKDGEKVLQYEDFIGFLKQLHEEIIRLEFSHYDCKQLGSIPAEDFGSSMVAAASMSNIHKYLDRVDALTEDSNFRGVRISFKDFQQFAKLRKKRRLLALSAQAVGGICGFSKADFQWAAAQVCEVDLSDTAVDIIFYIFDENGDGKLSMSEFLGVQDLREVVSVDPLQPGIAHMIRCMWNCAQKSCNGVYW